MAGLKNRRMRFSQTKSSARAGLYPRGRPSASGAMGRRWYSPPTSKLAHQPLTVVPAVRGGVVPPVFADADGGVQLALGDEIIVGGVLGGDFQGELGRLAHDPNPVVLLADDFVGVHVKGNVAVRRDVAPGATRVVVNEVVAADESAGLVGVTVLQQCVDVQELVVLLISVRQGRTVRCGIKNAVLVKVGSLFDGRLGDRGYFGLKAGNGRPRVVHAVLVEVRRLLDGKLPHLRRVEQGLAGPGSHGNPRSGSRKDTLSLRLWYGN